MGKHHLVEALGVDLLLDVGLCPQVLVVQLGLEAIWKVRYSPNISNNKNSMIGEFRTWKRRQLVHAL